MPQPGPPALLILAADLQQACLKRFNLEGKTLASCKGKALEGIRFQHPFYERQSPVYLGEYVTLDTGTGIVHSAPAYGVEDFDSNPGTGLTDMFIQPINLGWHQPRADFTVAYGLYLPTGRYEDGAANNTGLGMWAQEILLGSTLYLNPQRTIHAATTATFTFQSKKEDSDTKVGNIMNLEQVGDAVSAARPLIANNDLVEIFRSGKDRPDRPCTYCNKCLVNVVENPLGCYEEKRFPSHEAMLEQIMSVFRPESFTAEPAGV